MKELNTKKINKKALLLVMFIVIVVGGVILGYSSYKKSKSDFYTVKAVDGFIHYTSADADKYKIDSEDYVYGPYLLNITQNNYILVRLSDGNEYKSIGYIKLYYDGKNGEEPFYANWYSDNINFLCVKVKEEGNEKIHWYFLDENGKLIQLSDKILNGINEEEKKEEEKNVEIDNSQKETVEFNTQTDNIENKNLDSKMIYISDQTYNGYNVGVTKDKKIIVYKLTEQGVVEVFAKLDSYVSNDNLQNSNYIQSNGPGFYADWNNAGKKQIRVRVDKYLDKNGTNRYGYTWYVFDESAKLLSTNEYIDSNSLVYSSTNDYNNFKVGVTSNNKIMLYKSVNGANEVFAEFDSYVSNDNLQNSNYIQSNGPGFYADWNNAEKRQIRVRVDKYLDKNGMNRYGYTWYVFDENGKLLSTTKYIDSNKLVYKSSKTLGNYNIGVASNKKIVIYKLTEQGTFEVFAELDSYVSNDNLQNSNYVQSNGPGFYADWDNAGKRQIRVRVDKYLDKNGTNRYGYTWYVFDENGKLLNTNKYVDSNSLVYSSTNDYNKFKVGITNNNKIILYKSAYGVNEVFAELDSYVSNDNLQNSNYVQSNGPGFYADWDYAGKKQIRVRVDKYLDKNETSRYGYTWYVFDENGNLLSEKEFIS